MTVGEEVSWVQQTQIECFCDKRKTKVGSTDPSVMGAVCISSSCRRCGCRGWMSGRDVTACVKRWSVVVTCVLLTMTQVSSYSVNAYIWGPAMDEASGSGVTCWTCKDKRSNEECNNWAPDVECPFNQTVCQTVHRFAVPGFSSIQVTKRCVHASECSLSHIGCSSLDQSGQQQECTACCDVSYCNQEVPVNRTTAQQLSSLTEVQRSASGAARTLPSRGPLLVLVALSLLNAAGAVQTFLTISAHAVSLGLLPVCARWDVYRSEGVL